MSPGDLAREHVDAIHAGALPLELRDHDVYYGVVMELLAAATAPISHRTLADVIQRAQLQCRRDVARTIR
jgi:hypothetical protein